MNQSDRSNAAAARSAAQNALAPLASNIRTDETISHATYAVASRGGRATRFLSETDAAPSQTLPPIQLATKPQSDAEYQITGLLGAGGTARVELAHQRSLNRDVAIKSLLTATPGHTTAIASLMHEARITGALEHPNIVPIHALGRDAGGQLRLVMKRIEGSSWDALLRNPEHPAWPELQEEWGDTLGVHLQILMRVAAVTHFAHERGVIHRDIKPANVMVGRLGEIYLVDWGIAEKRDVIEAQHRVWQDADQGINPEHRRPPNHVVGTPTFMAPEMLLGYAEERTDVYLLGATLHKVLTGTGRHQGDGLMQIITHASESSPYPYADAIPTELAEIANRATHRNPDKRYASAMAFRRAIAAYIRRRSSEHLRVKGDRQREKLEQNSQFATENLLKSQQLYQAAIFSYQLALEEWPENERAHVGRDAAIEEMTMHEIRAGNRDAAARLIAEHRTPPENVASAYAALCEKIREEEAQAAKQQRLLQDIDPAIGKSTRAKWALIVAMLYLGTIATLALIFPDIQATTVEMLFFRVFGMLVCGAVVSVWMRAFIFRNAYNRQWWIFLTLVLVGVVCNRAIGWAIQSAANTVLLHDMLLGAVTSAFAGALLDRRLAWISLMFGGGILVAIVNPEWTWNIVRALSSLAFFPIAYIVWTPRSLTLSKAPSKSGAVD